jgi:hypothetical protein
MVVVLVRCVEQGSGRRGGGVATAVSIGMLYAVCCERTACLTTRTLTRK